MRLLHFAIIVLVSYIFFQLPWLLMGKPIPASLILMYMFFTIVTALLVMTCTEKGARELFAPIKALFEDPSKKQIRNIVFAVVPLIAAIITYNSVKPTFDAPVELRSTHPAPPSTLKAYGKTFNLATLENPLRKIEDEDPEQFEELVTEGGEIYFQNCFYCHGDKLFGKGHYGHGFDPMPLPFQGVDTIAQLQESYVFWRIATGGPGLPKEATPWKSSMPVWKDFLEEDEIWKVILFIYDYSENVPRSWE